MSESEHHIRSSMHGMYHTNHPLIRRFVSANSVNSSGRLLFHFSCGLFRVYEMKEENKKKRNVSVVCCGLWRVAFASMRDKFTVCISSSDSFNASCISTLQCTGSPRTSNALSSNASKRWAPFQIAINHGIFSTVVPQPSKSSVLLHFSSLFSVFGFVLHSFLLVECKVQLCDCGWYLLQKIFGGFLFVRAAKSVIETFDDSKPRIFIEV